MRLRLVFLMVLLCLVNKICGQNATITFQADKEVTISIYAPMDNAMNWQVVTDKVELNPHIRMIYELPVSDFCFVLCQYSDGNRCYLILQENDILTVNYSGNQILFSGKNAEGLVYYDRTFNGMSEFVSAMKEIFETDTDIKKNVTAIPKDIQNKVIAPTLAQIEQLYSDGKITLSLRQIIEKDFLYSTYGDAMKLFNWLLVYDKEKRLNEQGVIFATHYIDSIYSVLPPFDESILKYNYSSNYLSEYFKRLYWQLDEQLADSLVGKYGYDTFGSYIDYLLYPETFRSSKFGSAIMTELTFDFGDLFSKIDKDKLVKYFEENYPNSQYLPVIRKKVQEIRKNEAKTKEAIDSIIFLEDSIRSLKDFSSVKNLQGKYLYIDLWATWCMPCKQEFQYKEEVDEALAQYPDIVPVYISIDNDSLDPLWRKNISQYALNGYHLRASQSLQKDILQRVYKKEKSFLIPRYLLIDNSGNIVNDNLPRPRELNQLKEVLGELIK